MGMTKTYKILLFLSILLLAVGFVLGVLDNGPIA